MSRKTVLVVDDNAANRYIVCRVLQQARYLTIEAGTGAEAIQKARQFHPDAIVLDMNLPDETGIMTIKSLRREPESASIPVVFLSATAHSLSHREQAEAEGASAYLFSPVQPDTLVTVVRGIIQRGAAR